ncbi:hypothetical protein ASPVEDRAFT_718732 [Aspergillus versicolor CBS 583.65]|uniref:C2H2-type domain-containing protein n=1 Tax=Aspergillus versicolor CBS 583.65 TaxID=1036611 RepID=A0A1L9PNX9_ASPVE|nr:uncharacterized protein ASPVEDRAFT_718732 [Aspergillus versicolor CBS 583.65]OJJ03230.1 hypothetical protein ASPVEDRAFT_718732 [Aspergillus versicolor CBS 583.65]
MSLMLSQPPSTHSPPAQSARRLSVGAKTRTCVHCGRSFRRTEHLERHVRTHTKEKPYTCFCGAAFSRRDLLKRHMGITGHEDSNPPNAKNTSPKSQHRTDHDTKQRIRRASTTVRPRRTSSIQDPAQQDTVPPSPEDAEVPQWPMHQGTYMKQQDNGLLDSTINEATHDPEILEAAQLLLPNGIPHSFANHPSYSTAQSTPTTTYYPEETHHFEDFTNFLDSIGLPVDWPPGSSEANSNHNNQLPTEVAEPGLHPLFRERERERSRGNSPFRSWLPGVTPGDHQSYGMLSDYGNFHHYYHPPEDIARVVVPNF